MAPQLCISLLQEVILTFLKAHLPLTTEQRADINPKGPRRHHPHPQESQPDNPVEGAGANIKDSVLQATEEASKDALASSNAAPGALPNQTLRCRQNAARMGQSRTDNVLAVPPQSSQA